jgi:hypothetical protein
MDAPGSDQDGGLTGSLAIPVAQMGSAKPLPGPLFLSWRSDQQKIVGILRLGDLHR